MKIVIDIPEVYFEMLKKKTNEFVSGQRSGKTFMSVICGAVAKGTPLPKGHGRLIDADYLKDTSLVHNYHANNKYFVPYKDRKGYRLRDTEVRDAIINAKTIVEADKAEGSDKK